MQPYNPAPGQIPYGPCNPLQRKPASRPNGRNTLVGKIARQDPSPVPSAGYGKILSRPRQPPRRHLKISTRRSAARTRTRHKPTRSLKTPKRKLHAGKPFSRGGATAREVKAALVWDKHRSLYRSDALKNIERAAIITEETRRHIPLNVFLNARLIGRLIRQASGAIEFQYDPS